MSEHTRQLRASRARDERGASAVEYGLLVGGIAAVIVVIVFALGGTIQGAFDDTNKCVASNGATASCPSAPASTGGAG